MADQMMSQILIHINLLIWGTECFGLIIRANITGNDTFVLYKHHQSQN